MFCISSRSTRFILLAGLEPRASAGPLAPDVGLKETHLLVDPGLSLGHLPWSLARLLLGELVIMHSLGFKASSDMKGLELQFCRDFCPESLLLLSVMETSMLLVVQLWMHLHKLHNCSFLTVSECSCDICVCSTICNVPTIRYCTYNICIYI